MPLQCFTLDSITLAVITIIEESLMQGKRLYCWKSLKAAYIWALVRPKGGAPQRVCVCGFHVSKDLFS